MCDLGVSDSLETERHTSSMTATKYPICIKIPQINVWTNVTQGEAVSKYILMANANSTMISPRKKSKKEIAFPLAAAGVTRSLAIQPQRINHHNISERVRAINILAGANNDAPTYARTRLLPGATNSRSAAKRGCHTDWPCHAIWI
jgi:hypothetical protein